MTSKEFVKALNKRYSGRFIKFELASDPYPDRHTLLHISIKANYKHKTNSTSVTIGVSRSTDLAEVYSSIMRILHSQLLATGATEEAEYLYRIGK